MKVTYPIFGNPIFPLVVPSDQSLEANSIFYIFYCIEFTITLLTAPILMKFCFALDKTALFHRNLIIITKCHYFAYYSLQIVRLIVIFYELNVIRVDEEIQFPSVFLTICYASLFLRCSFVTILPSMLIERLVASYYIDDYEAKSRAWVAAVALTSSFSLAVCYTTPLIFGSVGIDRMVLFSVSVSFVFAIVFVKLYRRDRRRLKDFVMKNPNCYELSTRFQLVENLRVLKKLAKINEERDCSHTLLKSEEIIKNAVVGLCAWMPLPGGLLLLTFRYFLPNSESGQIVYASFDLMLSLSVAGILIFSLLALGVTPKWSCGNIWLRNKVEYGGQETRMVVTEEYFRNLQSAWK